MQSDGKPMYAANSADDEVTKDHGATIVACKNTAPVSRTTCKVSERTSIGLTPVPKERYV